MVILFRRNATINTVKGCRGFYLAGFDCPIYQDCGCTSTVVVVSVIRAITTEIFISAKIATALKATLHSAASKTSRAVTLPPVFSSMASAHFVGILSHCWTAWYVNPRARATALCDPKCSIVRSSVLSMTPTILDFLASCNYFCHGAKARFPCRIQNYE